MSTKDYVLGTDPQELQRLKLQHDLWKDHLVRLWQKTNLTPGQSVLELGCGPGFTTEDLSAYLKHQSPITAIDISDNFLSYLKSKNVPQVTTAKFFIESLDLPNKNFDAAFCRWLMIFVPDINVAIRKIHNHLKPKALFALQEYIAYDSFAIGPDHPIMKKVIDAVFKSWMDQGGYPNQGRRLPEVLEKNGFDVLEIEPIARVCRPSEPLWQWPETFFYTFIPKLVLNGYLTIEDQNLFYKTWEQLKVTPGAFCLAPTVVNIIAKKR